MIKKTARYDRSIYDNSINDVIAQTFDALDRETSEVDIDYKPLFYFLFNGVNNIIEDLSKDCDCCSHDLKKLQYDAEEILINQNEEGKVIQFPASLSN